MTHIVRDVKDAAAARPPQQTAAGLRVDGSLVDQVGRTFVQTDDSISEARALELAAAGAAVVWDSCGCGGGGRCELDSYTAEEVARMVASGQPAIAHTKRRRGVVSEWRAQDGTVLLLAQIEVRWGEFMS